MITFEHISIACHWPKPEFPSAGSAYVQLDVEESFDYDHVKMTIFHIWVWILLNWLRKVSLETGSCL